MNECSKCPRREPRGNSSYFSCRGGNPHFGRLVVWTGLAGIGYYRERKAGAQIAQISDADHAEKAKG